MSRNWLQFSAKRAPVVTVRLGNGVPFQACVLEVAKLGLPIEMVLGVDAFVNRRLQIDFREGRIYLIK